MLQDDYVNRKLLEKRLRLDGHDVIASINGQEAVNVIVDNRRLDCVLMDIQ